MRVEAISRTGNLCSAGLNGEERFLAALEMTVKTLAIWPTRSGLRYLEGRRPDLEDREGLARCANIVIGSHVYRFYQRAN